METLGQYLKREREFRKITIDEVSKATRVKASFLEALEGDRFAELPGPIFVKGFLRSYTLFIGLHVDEVLLRYQDHLQQEAQSDNASGFQKFAEVKPKRRLFPVLVALALLLLIAVYLTSR